MSGNSLSLRAQAHFFGSPATGWTRRRSMDDDGCERKPPVDRFLNTHPPAARGVGTSVHTVLQGYRRYDLVAYMSRLKLNLKLRLDVTYK